MTASSETKGQSTTRLTSRMIAAKRNPRDYALVERFVFDHGRWPENGDGRPYWALLRMRTANLIKQATMQRQSWETKQTFDWRTRTALRAVVRVARSSSRAQQIVRHAARSRESSTRRRGSATARAGDTGDRPRLGADLARPGGRASRRARGGAS